MQSRIVGTTMPVLEVALTDPQDAVISEAGELSWMTQSVEMTTHTQMGGGGGFFGVIKRVAGGGTIFMTEYRAVGSPGEVAFATKVPGHIVPIEVSPGHEFLVQSAWLFVCNVADPDRGRVPAVARGGDLWRGWISAAEDLRLRNGVAGALGAN